GGAGGDMGQCPASSSAYIEIAIGDRQTSASRTCLANDPGSQLVTAMSNLAGSRDEEELRAAAENELLEADRAFNAMAQADGVPAAFAHWAAEDAHQFSPGNDPARGRQAVTAFWANWPAGATLEWAPEHARVSSRGDMGWTWGRGVATVNGQQTRSRYVTIWVRDYDGNWRWAADIGNQDPAGAQ
ncbi:MAG: nuclear transport factor 2 family protein, partial [Hyphomonadaceae bacterium]